ncbi:MAG: hypothetical protein ACLP9L_21995, partial [Thermoguttaceae bacterium]
MAISAACWVSKQQSSRDVAGRRGIGSDIRGQSDPFAAELVGCTLEKDSVGKRWVVIKDGASVPGETLRLEWDEQQLTYMAEITRRTLQDHEPMIHVIQDFHSQRRLDQRVKLFGQRKGRNSTNTAFREARKWFLDAGLAGELPPEWCVIAKELAPPGWTSARRQPKPGDRNYAPWAAKKAK